MTSHTTHINEVTVVRYVTTCDNCTFKFEDSSKAVAKEAARQHEAAHTDSGDKVRLVRHITDHHGGLNREAGEQVVGRPHAAWNLNRLRAWHSRQHQQGQPDQNHRHGDGGNKSGQKVEEV